MTTPGTVVTNYSNSGRSSETVARSCRDSGNITLLQPSPALAPALALRPSPALQELRFYTLLQPSPAFSPAFALLVALLLCLLAAPAAAQGAAPPDPSFGRDYQLAHRGWNGLSSLGELAAAAGCPAEAHATLDWEALGGTDVLLVVYPERSLDPDRLHAFLQSGGRAVIADDFGAAAPALLRLGLRRREAPLPASVPSYRVGFGADESRAAALPLARPSRGTALGSAASELVTNHPAYLEGPLPATYSFLPGLGLVVEGSLGRGRFVALSDPSLLINNMLEIDGNRDFTRALLRQLCRPGEDRLLVLAGPFDERGSPPAVLTGAPPPRGDEESGPAARANQALSLANEHIQRTLGRAPGAGPGAAALTGVCLAIAALLLCLRYLPLLGPQHDPAFAQPPPGSNPQGGLPQLVERYARRDVPWGYLYPAALVREEVLRRLSPHLVGLPRYGDAARRPAPTAAEVERHVAARAGAEAGRLAALLWREFRTIPGRDPAGPGEDPLAATWVSERRMDRLHRLAVALFAELEKADRPVEDA